MHLPRLLLVLLALLAAAPLEAQKLSRKAFEDQRHGFQFKTPDDFSPVAPQSFEEEMGIVVKMAGEQLSVRASNGDFVYVDAEAVVLRFEERTVRGREGKGESISETKVRDDVGEYLERTYKGLDKDKPIVDEEEKVKKLVARHRTWKAQTPAYGIQLLIDAWSFDLPDADLHLVYLVPEEHEKKWMKVFEKSAKTFVPIERVEGLSLADDAGYEDLLAYHKEDAEKIAGWTALPTPSQKFILKTNSGNRRFLDEVVDRLEKSRELYERDFPPTKDFNHVSIVRVCATEEEFHTYGGTRSGTAGWFNPGTTELVLYDAVDVDRNGSYAVMSHEAFHQYCHFLFEQSEAHRWFDEGHGDYYGGAEFKRSKAIITKHMPGGLDRYPIIKTMVREGTYKPIAEHIHYDHAQWQSQGPDNVSCYAQSWSIVYMLRQGTLGDVSNKVWKDEYADILPSYVETLHAGYRAAYDEILAQRQAEADAEGREPTEEEMEVSRFNLRPDQRDEIWKAAMDASWGKIDVDQFEADWLAFVQDEL
jgi:hypothetical protein